MPIVNVNLGKDVRIPFPDLVNLYGCEIGDGCLIGPFVEIQSGVVIGPRSSIQSHSFVCSKVRIGAGVFVAHGVTFVNDRHPVRRESRHWEETVVEDGACIGSGSTILPCRIGRNALVGAGSVVTKDVEPDCVVAGNPARKRGRRNEHTPR
jgi:acetyltransferase-like isoleucine patch superfamily enzyme